MVLSLQQVESIMFNRVYYFSENDTSLYFQFERIELVLADYVNWDNYHDINDILELYSIDKVLKTGARSKNWDSEKTLNYEKTAKNIMSVCGNYFAKINDKTISELLGDLDKNYEDRFLELFDKFGLENRISGKLFYSFLEKTILSIGLVLQFKKLVISAYGEEIRDYLMKNVEISAPLLIKAYLENKKISLYFPKQLDADDKKWIISEYVDSEAADLNLLHLISISKVNEKGEFPLEIRTKLKAKKHYEEKSKLLFSNNSLFDFEISVSISNIDNPQDIISISKDDNQTVSITYDQNWLSENLDYATILNNFIYVFGFVDFNGRWTQINHPNSLGVIEKHIGVHGKDEYHFGIVFNYLQMVGNITMLCYHDFLEKYDISFENIFKWFFEEYLSNEFGAEGFIYNLPTKGASSLEKCRDIVIEMDSILKQYKLFCEDGYVNQELHQLNTSQMSISSIPSLLKNKYAYPVGDDIQMIMQMLFSDQSMLFFTESDIEHIPYKVLNRRKVYYHEFHEFQKNMINYLVDKKIFWISENDEILCDKRLLDVLYDLYSNDFICLYNCKMYEEQLLFLEQNKMIRYTGRCLLSELEQHYFNYIFNNSEYSNSLNLRNKYAHGNQNTDVIVQEHDYIIMLRLMVLLILKINEELCLAKSHIIT